MITFNALNPVVNINTLTEMANKAGANVINPEVFYSKQLLDTIRLDADQFVYYRLADAAPISNRADKLIIRRWAPLQAHTQPLVEGIPPQSDKGSVEHYELEAAQYGRYMEFTDKVDFKVVDPVVAHYTQEYSLVAMETLDLLAKQVMLSLANRFYAGMEATFEDLTMESKPSLDDLRKIVLSMKKQLVKPRANGYFTVISSPDFTFDMVTDPRIEKFMTINWSTKEVYGKGGLPPMFNMEFTESLAVPTSGEFVKIVDNAPVKALRVYRGEPGNYVYATILETDLAKDGIRTYFGTISGYVTDSRTGQDASYIPGQSIWDLEHYNADKAPQVWSELKAQHIFVVGKEALLRTGLQGEDSAKMYVKPKGSSGVLDPIDQRQSIGFKINSVGFGSTRLEAIVDYICVPSQANLS